MAKALNILVRNEKVPWQRFKTKLRGTRFEFQLWHTSDGKVWFSMFTAMGQAPIVRGMLVRLGTDLLKFAQTNPLVTGLHITPKATTAGITTATQDKVRNGVELIVEDADDA